MLLEAQLTLEILRTNPALSHEMAEHYAAWVMEESSERHIDPWLVHAIVHIESRWTAEAVRHEGNRTCSVGLGQANGSCTPKRLAALKDARENLRVTAAHLASLRASCRKGCEGLGWIRGYNAGSPAFVRNVRSIVERCHTTYASLGRVCPVLHVPRLPRAPDVYPRDGCGPAGGSESPA